MTIGNRFFLVLFLLGSAAYLTVISFGRFPFDYLLKVAPILVLIGFARRTLAGRARTLTLAALVFSAGGDVLLALSFPNQFIFGLGSFLIAQIMYLVVFLQYRNSDHIAAKNVLSGLIFIYAVIIGGMVTPEQIELKIAIVSYLVIICCMVLAAVRAWSGAYLHVLGAVSFMISDSIIAWDRFHEPLPFAAVAVMATYYLAQGLIVLGVRDLSTQAREQRA